MSLWKLALGFCLRFFIKWYLYENRKAAIGIKLSIPVAALADLFGTKDTVACISQAGADISMFI